MTVHIVCRNPLTYEEILNWRGFSFETSHVIAARPITNTYGLLEEVDNMLYGMEESERIIDNVVSKQIEARRVERIINHIIKPR